MKTKILSYLGLGMVLCVNGGWDSQNVRTSENTIFSEPREDETKEEVCLETASEHSRFTLEEIRRDGELYQRITGKSYQENDDISLENLRYLSILYYDFGHKVQTGELIVNETIAEDCLEIFRQLYEAEYELASVRLIDEYWAGDGDSTDTASVEANNTSAFCYRMTTSGKSLSKHALGCAIDINPRQNPYFDFVDGQAIWYHDGDESYLDRSEIKEHMITEEDLCYQLFTEYGFTWGGNWNNPKDYQHFERK